MSPVNRCLAARRLGVDPTGVNLLADDTNTNNPYFFLDVFLRRSSDTPLALADQEDSPQGTGSVFQTCFTPSISTCNNLSCGGGDRCPQRPRANFYRLIGITAHVIRWDAKTPMASDVVLE